MTGGLFSEADLDPELIEKERSQIEREKERKALEKEKSKKEEKDDAVYDKTLFIVDGYAFIYRSYYAHKSKPLTDREGNNISAYYGFFQTLFYLLDNYKMDGLAVAMDTREPTFRHIMYPEYKAQREKSPEDLHSMVEPIKSTLKKMNIPVVFKSGFEADDVIASISKKAKSEGWNTVIVSGDKDICQLVGPHISVLSPPKKDKAVYTLLSPKEVKEQYSVYPEQIVDYLSICGDKADNVPGVKGLGEKTASRLLEEYVSLDGIYRHLDSLKLSEKNKLIEDKDNAYFSKKLIVLSFDAVPDGFDLRETLLSGFNKLNAIDDFEKFNITRLNGKLITTILEGSKKEGETVEDREEEKLEAKSLLLDSEKYLLDKGEYSLLNSLVAIKKDFDNIVSFSNGVISLFFLSEDYSDISTSVGFAYSSEPKKAVYVPLGENGITFEELTELIKQYFTSGKIKIIAHGGESILRLLFSTNEDGTIYSDTMIMAWLLSSNDGVYNLNSSVSKYFSQTLLDIKDITGSAKLNEVDTSLLARYSSLRADYTYRLNRVLERRIYERGLDKVYKTMELPLIRVLASMEREGIYLSKEKMAELKGVIDDRIKKLEDSIYLLAGYNFNINSTQQLGKLLYDERKLPALKKTARGFSTDTATLEALKKSTEDPIIDLLLEYRQKSKLKSTYIDVLPTLRDKNGRIHTSFLQTGTATGRLSSRNPNLQNIPVRTDDGRLIRSAFVPEEGKIFISADYAQIELVVLAWLSDDEELKKAFISGEDVHRYTAALIFNKDMASITSQERRVAKTINFGIMYGMSAFRLSNELDITRSEAKEFITRYFERYSSVKGFVEKVNKKAEEMGYVKTHWGHEREILGINSSNKTERAASERTALNTVIQGTAAEIMKMAMIELFSELKKRGLFSKMLLQVHDELIFEVPLSEADEMERIIKEKMERVVTLTIPLRVSIERGLSWGDMHE